MDIVQERLEREYDLDLLATAPSVEYHVLMTDGGEIEVDSPAELPDPEPHRRDPRAVDDVSIVAPDRYIGAVMELVDEPPRRLREDGVPRERTGVTGEGSGEVQEGDRRVLLEYKMPLSEILVDFYDQLKSRTQGYASPRLRRLADYAGERLVKLDILVNGVPVDALSALIARRQGARRTGRELVEKLRSLIPRQMFDVPIQAAIGGRIIARETWRRCARTCSPSATAATSRASASCWRSRRRARSA